MSSVSCYAWQAAPGPMPDAAVSAINSGQEFRARLKTGGNVHFVSAEVIGDSIVGLSGDRPRSKWSFLCGTLCEIAAMMEPAKRQAIPLSDVQSVQLHKFSPGKTLLGFVVSVGAALLLFMLIFADFSG